MNGWEQEFEKIKDIYSKLGIGEKLAVLNFCGDHEIPEDLATDLLIKMLRSHQPSSVSTMVHHA